MKRAEVVEKIIQIHRWQDENKFGLKHKDVLQEIDDGISIVSVRRIHKGNSKFREVARSRYLLKDEYRRC